MPPARREPVFLWFSQSEFICCCLICILCYHPRPPQHQHTFIIPKRNGAEPDSAPGVSVSLSPGSSTSFLCKDPRYCNWRDSSVVKCTGCSCKGSGFYSWYPHGSSQPSVIPVREDLMPFSGLCRHWSLVWYKDTCACIKHSCTFSINKAQGTPHFPTHLFHISVSPEARDWGGKSQVTLDRHILNPKKEEKPIVSRGLFWGQTMSKTNWHLYL